MMQRYRSHKTVLAGKIQALHWVDSDQGPDRPQALLCATVGGQQYELPDNFAARGKPALGDYLVRYADGYLSWSPAKPFEEGYTLVYHGDSPPKESDPVTAQDLARLLIPALQLLEQAIRRGEKADLNPLIDHLDTHVLGNTGIKRPTENSGNITLPIEPAKMGVKRP